MTSKDLNTSLTRTVDLTNAASAAVVKLSAWAKYDIEKDYDALYGEVSSDGGVSWRKVGELLDGVSGGALDANGDPAFGSSAWTPISYDLSAYAGKSVQFRFRYATDGGLHFDGSFLDDLALTVNGASTWTDSVENLDAGWTASGITRMGGSTSVTVANSYLAENRVYAGYDATLKTGPYNFGWSTTRPTGSSGSRTRTVCWSGTPTAPAPTTTPSTTRVVVRCFRSTRVLRRSCSMPLTGSATVGSRSTRPSAWRPLTR